MQFSSYISSLLSVIFCLGSYLAGGTPLEYALSLTGGYDSNVLRFSDEEFEKAENSPNIMGDLKTFDSFVSKYKISLKKSFIINMKKSVGLNGFFTYSDYNNSTEKKYWSSGVDIFFKWGSYKNIKYSLRHLDKFYLRHYVNRDISTVSLSPCLFTDRNQSIVLTSKLSKRIWYSLGSGYLQRYYSKPFTEFDLDISYLKARVNYKLRKIGTIGLQVNGGRAKNDSHLGTQRPSSFNRSYRTIEWYLPLTFSGRLPIINELGFAARIENRFYDAENLDDPLHAGRNHQDSKYDLWIKKKLSDEVAIKLTSRYRKRTTDSKYLWVKDLKSFRQLQFWFNIEWDLIYDKY